MIVGMIWAQAQGRAIGAGGTIPWHVPEDLALFKRVTLGHGVIMGRKTWDSLPDSYRPLPGRDNIVVTRNADFVADGAVVATSIDGAIEIARERGHGQAWIMGGAQIYADALDVAEALVVTDLDIEVDDAEAFAPPIPLNWDVAACEPDRGWLSANNGVNYRFSVYRRPGSTFGNDADPLRRDSPIRHSHNL